MRAGQTRRGGFVFLPEGAHQPQRLGICGSCILTSLGPFCSLVNMNLPRRDCPAAGLFFAGLARQHAPAQKRFRGPIAGELFSLLQLFYFRS
jgi:hypothetical protein